MPTEDRRGRDATLQQLVYSGLARTAPYSGTSGMVSGSSGASHSA